MRQLQAALTEKAELLGHLFRAMENDDAFCRVDLVEFRWGLRAMGIEALDEDLRSLFDSFDLDGAGQIVWEEMRSILAAQREGDQRFGARHGPDEW
jgi:Ca2+-binding EF-hand superfamily protein